MPVRVGRSLSFSSSNTAAPSCASAGSTAGSSTASASTTTSSSSKLPALPLRIWNKNNSYSYSNTTTTTSAFTATTTTSTSTPAPTPSRRRHTVQSLPQSQPPPPPPQSRGRSPSPLRIGRKISRSLSRTSGTTKHNSHNNKCAKSQVPNLPTPRDGLPIVFLHRQDLQVGPLLGEGGFARVYACSSSWMHQEQGVQQREQEPDDWKQYAVKIIRPEVLQPLLAEPSSASASAATATPSKPSTATTNTENSNHSHHHSHHHHQLPKEKQAEVALLKKTKAIQDFFFEVHILTQLSLEPHPHIITLRGLTTTSPSNSNSNQDHQDLGLVLDQIHETLAERIDLWRRQEKQQPPPQQNNMEPFVLLHTKMTYAYQIAQALSHLHQRRILYRDLKPENLGFRKNANASNNKDDERLQLFDFGMARELPPPNSSVEYKWTICGTQRYMAPEVLLRGHYTLSSDCYTWAMVVWELLALQKPFHYMTPSVHKILVCQQGDRPRVPKETPDYMCELLKQCWAPKVTDRCSSMEQVCTQLEPHHQNGATNKLLAATTNGNGNVTTVEQQNDSSANTEKATTNNTTIPTPSPENSTTMNLSVCTTGTASSNTHRNIIPPSPAPSPAPSPSRRSIFRRNSSMDSATDKSLGCDKENDDASIAMSTATGGSNSVTSGGNNIRPIPPPPPPPAARKQQHRHHRRVNSGGSNYSNQDATLASNGNALIPLPPSSSSSSSRHKRTNSGTPVLTGGSLPPIASTNNGTTSTTNHDTQHKHKRSHSALPSLQAVTTGDDKNDKPEPPVSATGNVRKNSNKNEMGEAPFARSTTTTGIAVDHDSRTSKNFQNGAPFARANTTGRVASPSTPSSKSKSGSRSIWNRRSKASSPPLLQTPSVDTTTMTTAPGPPLLKHRRTNSGSPIMMVNNNSNGNENNINNSNTLPYYMLPVGKKSLPILSHSVPSSPARSIYYKRSDSGSTTASSASGGMSPGPYALNDYLYDPSPAQEHLDDDCMPLMTPTLGSSNNSRPTVVTPTAPSKARATLSSAAAGLAAAIVSPIASLTYSLSASFDAGTTTSDNGNDGLDGATNNNSTTKTTTSAAASKGPSLSEFQRQKHALKERLKQYDIAFAQKHGRMPRKREKEPVRALYEHYNALKSCIEQLEVMKQQLKDYDIKFAQMRGRIPSTTEKQVIRHLYDQYKTKKNDVAVFLQEFNNNPKNDPLRHHVIVLEDDSFMLRRQAGTISLFRHKQHLQQPRASNTNDISSVHRGSGGDGGSSSSLLNFISLGSFDSYISAEGIEVAEL